MQEIFHANGILYRMASVSGNGDVAEEIAKAFCKPDDESTLSLSETVRANFSIAFYALKLPHYPSHTITSAAALNSID